MIEKEIIIEREREVEEKKESGERERSEIKEPSFEAEKFKEKKEKTEKETERKETAAEKLEKLREQFKELREKIEAKKEAERQPFKEFAPYFVSHNRIELPPEKQEELEKQLLAFQAKNKFAGPRLATGSKTATEYDSRAENWSTKTAIQELSSGEKVFVVNSYPSSLIHRLLDSVMRRFAEVRNFKSPNPVWKETFEKRSNIPTIKTGNKDCVVMPYIENVNLRDLLTYNKEIKNWGPIEWAKDVVLEDKKEIVRKITKEVEKIHRQGKTWGEAILANMIIDKNKKVWICDPEILFYKEVSVIEQKASDLKDIIYTSAASLSYSEKFEDYHEVVRLVFENYGDKEVVEAAVRAANKKPGLRQRLAFVYHKARYLPMKNYKMHEKIRQAIADYGKKE